ncbi:Ger(x)C family spore germination protein [Paenibacillus sp. ATY16]|uniref:Ger(x)C family spore germination protein n=1 Tax=Paenibacillus sp. ATY16 TaxID=1759312 RepID=UPI00200C4971|nr:Ger(x)C family spore germination protein [Paenibacillus sp. ATY16]MCK9860970.1 Ger(x)C family spore germination protein [Paenibacillus sp. ATY16]
MRIKRLGLIASILLLLPLFGCWDRRELNDRLFELGSGVDLIEDGKILMVGQFMIPAKSGDTGSGEKQSYFIETGTGKNAFDGLFDMQLKLSRRITRAHRHNIYIGEKMAESGISNLLDSVTRDPDSRIRSDIWVVKGGTALEFMQMTFPLEKMPAIALSKSRQIIGKKIGNSVLEILIAENVEGNGPTLPTVELFYDRKLRKKTFHVYGRAILNRKQQLAGYYDAMESAYRLWVIGETKRIPITVQMANGQGTFSVEIQRTTCQIRMEASSGQVNIEVKLKGGAIVQESNTSWDLRQTNDLQTYEAELNRHVEAAVSSIIQKAQKEFKVDVFLFGRTLSRQHPEQWTALNSRWEQAFSGAKVSVHSHVKIKQIGLQGPPPNHDKP